MNKTKVKSELNRLNLIKLLKSFSLKEIKEFDKFVRSPFFNNQSTLIRLNGELKKYYPEFTHPDFTKQKIYQAINPDTEYDDTKFRKYFSNLFKLAEEFLMSIENNSSLKRKRLDLLEQYDKRNLNDFFHTVINEIDSKNHIKNYVSREFFIENHFREESKLIHNIRTNRLNLIPPDIKSSHSNLILHLLMVTTIYCNILLVNRKSFKDTEFCNYTDEFLKLFDFWDYYKKFETQNEEVKSFVELCRFDILLAQDSFNKKNLDKMKSLLLKCADSLNDNLLYTFISHLNIYYLINIEKGNKDFDNELFGNYKFMIDKGIYESDNIKFINYSEFRTILAIALKIKEFTWAKDFINEYGKGFRDDYLNYSNAFLFYEMTEYEESLKYLPKVKLEDVFLKLDVSILNAMIYYELNYFDSAMSTAESFRRYMKENELLSAEVKTSHLNFINSYKSILKFRESDNNIFDLGKLKKEIEDFSIVRRKKWLLEKIDELVNRKSGK